MSAIEDKPAETVEVFEEENPFRLPPDADIFLLREKEAKEKAEARERQKALKIWEKSTTSGQAATAKFKFPSSQTAKASSPKAHRAKSEAPHSPTYVSSRRDGENMAEFIAKKRDMFLLQMSLDTKKDEIKKLEDKAQMKEEALRKSEVMLQEDAMRFDAFLKENDKKAHDALKKADKETKLKQEKAAEIKKLNQEISKVESEMAKYEDRLGFCLKYKEFLDKLTPPDPRATASTEGGSGEAAPAASPTMFFKDPSQLLDIFSQLEERNLFLIQNVQETEEALEELKQKFEDSKSQLEEKTTQLKSNIDELKRKIQVEEEKAAALTQRARTNTSSGDQNALLQELAAKVSEVYIRCGFDTADSDTLDMLREVEGKLEDLLVQISKMPKDVLAKGEKEKETERRERVRVAKYKEQQRQYEERLRKSNARARAEVVKRTGKPVMFRSAPLRAKKVKQDTQINKDKEAEDIKRFFT